MFYIDSIYYRFTLNTVLLISRWTFSDYTAIFHLAVKCCIVFVLVSNLIQQFLLFSTHKLTMELVSETTPSIYQAGSSLLLIFILWVNFKNLEKLLILTEDHINEERTEQENAVQVKYTERGKMITKYFAILGIVGVASAAQGCFLPQLFDIILPLNETRPRLLPFRVEFVLDQHKHFNYVALYTLSVVSAQLLVIVATENAMYFSVQQACAMFEIVGCKLENSLHIRHPEMENKTIDKVVLDNVIIPKVKDCIKYHLKTLEFVTVMNTFAEPLALVAVLTTLIGTSVLLVTFSNLGDVDPQLLFLTGGMLTQFFLLNFNGQEVTNVSARLMIKAYDTEWYDCPVIAQKLLLLLLLRSQRFSTISAKSFCVLSMETFSVVVRASVSYCLVLKEFA